MKKIIMLVLLALAGVITWYFLVTKPKPDNEVPKQQPVAISVHTDSFNTALNAAMSSYYGLTEAFVNWDSAAVNSNAAQLKNHLQGINLDEFKAEGAIHQTAMEYVNASEQKVKDITIAKELSEKRKAFNSLSQNMYDLLRTVQYDNSKIYLQECPMAFNDTEPGLWLSKTEDIRNPYLGLHHPKYGKAMLVCGETKDEIYYGDNAKRAQ